MTPQQTGMDQAIERQIIRVLGAFQRAAEKHWGPETPLAMSDPHRVGTPRKESAKRRTVTAYLREHPKAGNRQIIAATGAGKTIIADTRRELGVRPDRTRNSMQIERIAAALEKHPTATVAEIARIADVKKRYAQDVVRRLKAQKGPEGA